MSDQWNVTAAYDKPAYNAGDVMTIAITGNDVVTDTTTTVAPSGTVTLTITNPTNNSVTTITVPPQNITTTTTTTTPESVKITAVVDDSNRQWVIDPSGLSATATA